MTPLQSFIYDAIKGKGRLTTEQVAEMVGMSPHAVAAHLCYMRGNNIVIDHQLSSTIYPEGVASSQNKNIKDRWEA